MSKNAKNVLTGVIILVVIGLVLYYSGLLAARPCGSAQNPCPPPTPPPAPTVLYEFDGISGDSLGSAVVFADVNGDFVPDVIVGAENANSGSGYVRVYNGANTSQILYQVNGNAGDFLGARLAVGDVNGDGVSDIAAGAYGVDVGSVVDAGAVKVFNGINGSLIFQLNGATGTSKFMGSSVAIGDVTGDGKGDILGGTWGGGLSAGIGYVLLFNGADGAVLARYDGYENNDEMGRGVAFGDVNGDGTLDLVLGAGNSFGTWKGGYIRVINGVNLTQILYEFGALTKITKPEPDFGYAVAAADINNDGKAEMFVSAYRGKTLNSRGDATGYVRVFNGADATLLYQVNGNLPSDEFGRSLALGDVNGDGIKDIIVGAPIVNTTTNNYGYVKAFNGINGALLATYNATALQELFGASVAAADIDGTGKANVAGGAYYGSSASGFNGYVKIFPDIP